MPRGDILKYGNYVFELVEVPPFDSVQMTTFLDGAAIVEREDEEGHSLFGLINNHGDFVIPTNCRYIEYWGRVYSRFLSMESIAISMTVKGIG